MAGGGGGGEARQHSLSQCLRHKGLETCWVRMHWGHRLVVVVLLLLQGLGLGRGQVAAQEVVRART